MLLHPNDWIEFLLLKNGEYEPLTLRFIQENLGPGQTALFAGVNFGLHLVVASRCVSDSGCVIGVEPQPKSLHRAYSNIMLNDLPANIRLVSGALGKETDLVPMDSAPEHNSGAASIVQSSSRLPFHVFVAPLGDVLRRLNIDRLDFMLLDVEGYELQVLDGIPEDKRPPLLVIEVNPEILEPLRITEERVYERLAGMGYSCWSLNGKSLKPNDHAPEYNVIALLEGSRQPEWI